MFCEEGNCSSVFSMSSHWKTSFEGWNHAQTKKQLEETTKMMKETLERDSEELKRKQEKAQEAMEMNGKNKEEIGK